jgi:hypothetical protein
MANKARREVGVRGKGGAGECYRGDSHEAPGSKQHRGGAGGKSEGLGSLSVMRCNLLPGRPPVTLAKAARKVFLVTTPSQRYM